MDNNSNMLQLCRLCLVKDDVNIPIFEEQGDIRQIFLKISSCLPVKVSRDDELPKKICDGCSYKLDMLYEFWNTSANAEKQLLTWLGEAGMTSKMADGTISAVAQQIKPADAFVKQETIDPPDIHSDDDDKRFVYKNKQEEKTKNEEPPPKRARRTAAVKAAIAMDQNSDDDDDSGEPMTKVEDDSDDSDNDDHDAAYVDAPSTSADDQPGPSGVGKDGVEAPYQCMLCEKVFSNKIKLKGHMRVHKQKNITCDVCGKKFLYRNKMLHHKQSVHLAGYTHKCDKCESSFKTALTLKQHVQNMHLKNYTFVCDKCGRGFFLKKLLDMHYKVEHEDIRFNCEFCLKPFKTLQGLISHVGIHDPNFKKNEYTCKECFLVYTSRVYMREKATSMNTVKNRMCIWKQFTDFCRDRNYVLCQNVETKYLAGILEDWAKNMKRLDGTDYKERAIKTIWNVTAKVLQAKYEHEFNRKFNPFIDDAFTHARRARNIKMKELGACVLNRKLSHEIFSVAEYKRMLDSCDENSPDGLQKKFFMIASYELFWRCGEARKCKVTHFKEVLLNHLGLAKTVIEYNALADKETNERPVYTDSKWLFQNTDRPEYCPVRLYRLLKQKRPNLCSTDKFFLAANKSRFGDYNRPWYNNQGAGRNQLSVWIKQVAESIGINTALRKVTNQSPKMSAIVHLTSGGYLETEVLKLIGGRISVFPIGQANILQYETLIKKLRQEFEKEIQLIVEHNYCNNPMFPSSETSVKLEIED